MAFPPGDYVKVTVLGNITGGESFAFSHYQEITGLVALPTTTQFNTMMGHVEAQAAVLWAQLKTKCSSAISYSGCRFAFIRNGVTALTGSVFEATPIPGTSGTNMPVYIARVVTLRTARAGRSYRGRMYLPYNGVAFSAGGVLWASDATTLASVKTFITTTTSNVLGDLAGTTAGPVIYSPTAGAHEPVTSLTMDNKADTQRGREKSITPTVTDTVAIP